MTLFGIITLLTDFLSAGPAKTPILWSFAESHGIGHNDFEAACEYLRASCEIVKQHGAYVLARHVTTAVDDGEAEPAPVAESKPRPRRALKCHKSSTLDPADADRQCPVCIRVGPECGFGPRKSVCRQCRIQRNRDLAAGLTLAPIPKLKRPKKCVDCGQSEADGVEFRSRERCRTCFNVWQARIAREKRAEAAAVNATPSVAEVAG
jgi:uncharacterized protein (DUF1330 family)